ncbi:MAG: response regulator [Aquisalimonadaceae bacterium]
MGISKALVVDDSRLARVALTKLLAKRGLDVDTAASGGEALDYLREGSPDVVFIDYMMPDMDGFQAAEAINRLRGVGAMPLVMYTSQDTPEDRRRARDLGICGFLTKPTSEEGLDAVLDEVDDWHATASTLGTDTDEDEETDDNGLPDEALAALEEYEAVLPEPAPASSAAREPKPKPKPTPKSEPEPESEPEVPAPERAGATPVDKPADARPVVSADSEQRVRQIANQVARGVLEDARAEWQQQFHELAAELQESTSEAANLAGREASDRMGQETLAELRQEWNRLQSEWHQASVSGAEKVARGIADSVARDVAEEIADAAARRVTTQLVEEFASHFEGGGAVSESQAEDIEVRVTVALQSVVNELATDQNFQTQVVAVVSDQGVPLLKNALDHWVRQVARDAAEQAVRDAVIKGTEALIQETVVASAQAAAREVRSMQRKGRMIGIAAWVVLALGVVAALLIAV